VAETFGAVLLTRDRCLAATAHRFVAVELV